MSETIVALATPAGDSALATIRISGALSECLAKDALSLPSPTPRHSYLGNYKSSDAEIIDQVIFCFYEQNKSFTGEKMLEISCHGNPIIVQKILSDLVLSFGKFSRFLSLFPYSSISFSAIGIR